MENDDFIDGLLRKDKLTQKSIFVKYHRLIKSIAMRYAKNQEDSDEIVNDVFLKIFSKIDNYNPEYTFLNWISRIAVNTSIDRYRKNIKKITLVHYNPEYDKNFFEYQDIDIDEKKEVLPIIRQLPERYRIIFNLFVFEEYSHAEISKMLNIAEGTSRSSLTRAKKIIKNHLVESRNLNKSHAAARV